eukprot:c9930_g1_i1.p1 GENE.c9930_g1_i1~~c9930_g1_i1.p1  ORF type:complete len:833 (-),score=193.94 c9930_g1_i1:99-2597(-)
MSRVSVLRGSIFRSEPMVYVQMYISNDAAHATVYELGLCGLVQFVDLNPDVSLFQRPNAHAVKRCDEMMRRLRVLKGFVIEEGLETEMKKKWAIVLSNISFDDLEHTLGELDSTLVVVNKDIDGLTASLNHNIEYLQVLTRCEELFKSFSLSGVDVQGESSSVSVGSTHDTTSRLLSSDSAAIAMELGDAPDMAGKVRTVVGTVPQSKVEVLERILFRVSRGNSVVRFSDESDWLQDPTTSQKVEKRVFCIFYYSSAMGERIAKVITALGCNTHSFPSGERSRQEKRRELGQAIRELRSVLERTHDERRRDLEVVANNFGAWWKQVEREKAVYHTLNLFEHDNMNRSCLVAEGWCARRRLDDVQAALQRALEQSGAQVPSVCSEIPTAEQAPTYFATNKLTAGFQAIIDAYGIARYQEMNPMPFTVITFPFLFAVMFGDFGHGVLMLLFAVYLLVNESYYLKNKPGEMFMMLFEGRYVILLMALFSLYTGALYNDTFAMSADVFGSAYNITESGYAEKIGPTYPFGLDPIWKQAENELSYTNSLKMKMSIVFGVTQMLFGVLLSAFNHYHFGNWISLFNEFVPQIIFLCSVFGYMMIIILVKWSTFYENTHCAPSILATFIDMFLAMGEVNPADDDCPGTAGFFSDQKPTQQFLLSVAILSVPWMLFAKPLLEHHKHNRKVVLHETRLLFPSETSVKDARNAVVQEDGTAKPKIHGYDFAEEMVHQIIHTIEFVLGAVSNTASYLRLWALSLAHSQLSAVFWEKAMVEALNSGNWFLIIVGFFVWAMCTLCVLMVMESLSAFLHALRLHWVEFQNKFYSGTGTRFMPFTFSS